jgi:hypothetical protein
MSRAQIVNGRWSRNVLWKQAGQWRTDMFKSVLADARLKEAEFICKDGPRIIIPADDLRTVLPKGNDHFDGKIWGPFNIDSSNSSVDGHPVRMTIESK